MSQQLIIIFSWSRQSFSQNQYYERYSWWLESDWNTLLSFCFEVLALYLQMWLYFYIFYILPRENMIKVSTSGCQLFPLVILNKNSCLFAFQPKRYFPIIILSIFKNFEQGIFTWNFHEKVFSYIQFYWHVYLLKDLHLPPLVKNPSTNPRNFLSLFSLLYVTVKCPWASFCWCNKT